MSVLKPLKGEPLTFWHVAGDIIWRGDHPKAINRQQADALRELYSDEARAAYRAGDMAASRAAAKLWIQITCATYGQDTWRRVVACDRRAA